ncbi:MAG: NlpC/P60 family protein [Paracoccaceae bacterium]
MRTNVIISAARCWLGTPYVHQMSRKGAGCDCLGLVRGVWREVMGEEPEQVPAYSPDWSEPQSDESLWKAASRHMIKRDVDTHVPGDVILFRMRDGSVAKHLGFAAVTRAGPSFIHAYSGHGVVESALSAPWARRIVARFSFPKEHF